MQRSKPLSELVVSNLLKNTPAGRYLVTAFLSFGVLSPVAFFLSHPMWAFACRPSLGANEIVAYCHSEQYGNYEHAAYFLDLEPRIVENFRQAKILFFGNSRLQFGLARPVAQSALTRLGTGVHSAAFSYNEAMPFASALIKRYKPHPRAVVINVDPFFWDRSSPPAREVLAENPISRIAYRLKRDMMHLQRRVCGSSPKTFWPCNGEAPVVLRKFDGTWVVDYIDKPKHIPFVETEKKFMQLAISSQIKAERFLNLLGTARQCVIFTSMPSPHSTRALAKDLATKLGVEFIAPNLTDLKTFDKTHLDVESANRWAKAFFSEADAKIHNCIHGGGENFATN